MRAGFGGFQDGSRCNSKNQGGSNCQEKRCANRYAHLHGWNANFAGVLRALGGGEGKAQIIGCSHSGVQQSDDGENDCAAADRGRE